MWLNFEGIEHRSDLESKKGKMYSAYVMTATKRGYGDEEDSPYSKIIFETVFTTVTDRAGTAELAVHEFFEACEPGDLVIMTNERDGDNWRIKSLENKTRSVLPEGTVTASAAAPAASQASGWESAVGFVDVLVNNGHYKDKTSPEILLDAVVTYRMRLDALDSVALDAPLEEYDEAA